MLVLSYLGAIKTKLCSCLVKWLGEINTQKSLWTNTNVAPYNSFVLVGLFLVVLGLFFFALRRKQPFYFGMVKFYLLDFLFLIAAFVLWYNLEA